MDLPGSSDLCVESMYILRITVLLCRHKTDGEGSFYKSSGRFRICQTGRQPLSFGQKPIIWGDLYQKRFKSVYTTAGTSL